ncbi:LysR substrate-binding domain-containing protein [Halobacillus mangrovi]|uniref:LysR family transcriptional regulator n=1 Tax=Halobacillus mangrovi TaxID=402384 RepID=A0A1W6A0A4_9BACI|nr:LysR substrate-binding domain-containing protein [Halobacillus mangrovi]ARI78942.1 LysR family transcriptional regulator [Halobacillus mangrovi]
MDFEAMKTFVTAVDLQSFTKASQKLNLSQPTVSFHIKSLENYFNSTLIDRSPKRFKITQTGELVYQRAKQILGVIDKAQNEVYEFQNQMRGNIHIGASYTVGEYILPSILKGFDDLYPDVDLHVRIANSERINRAIQLHELDVGLVEGQVKQQGLASTPFSEDEMIVIVPPDHPLREESSQSFQHIQNQTWISREIGSGTRAMLDLMMDSYNISPKKLITIGSNHGVVQAVKEGLGLSFISRTVVENTGAEELILDLPYVKSMTRYFSIVTPENKEEQSKNVQVFIDQMADLYALKLS